MIRPVIIPWVTNFPMTKDTVEDVLCQDLPQGDQLQVILVGNGIRPQEDLECRQYLRDISDRRVIYHSPPLRVSLATVWNRSLVACWEMGAESALVVNNDIRLDARTLKILQEVVTQESALFVSGVGVTEEQFRASLVRQVIDVYDVHAGHGDLLLSKGGPDFSCYLISKECHFKYQFDEGFFPAYCEDLDYHRRLMLGGDGARIFGVNLPFWHIDRGSGTLKSMPQVEREAVEVAIGRSRAYYAEKWGGTINRETFLSPFGKREPSLSEVVCHVTTPDLQRHGCAGVRKATEADYMER